MKNLLSLEDYINLADKQRELDRVILERSEVKEVSRERVELYYRDEAAECVRELKGDYKHWSIKPAQRDAMVEEFVDALHFFLSWSNKEVDELSDVPGLLEGNKAKGYEALLEQVDNYHYWIAPNNEQKPEIWKVAKGVLAADNITNSFAHLCYLLERYGLTRDELITAYDDKHKINYERSDSGVY